MKLRELVHLSMAQFIVNDGGSLERKSCILHHSVHVVLAYSITYIEAQKINAIWLSEIIKLKLIKYSIHGYTDGASFSMHYDCLRYC